MPNAVVPSVLRVGRMLLPLALRKRLGPWWHNYFAWPMPLWRLRPQTTLEFGSHRFRFVDLRARDYIEWARRARHQAWEPDVIRFLLASIQPGDVVLDVGGYVGPYALLASRLAGDEGRVYSFEPDPIARRLLTQNVRANRCANVVILPTALSDKNARMALDGIGDSTSRVIEGSGNIEATTLNRFCRDHDVSPDVMKMDIEGGEEAALLDEAALIALQDMRAVLLEVHPGVDYARIEATMRRAGKRPQRLAGGSPGHFHVAFTSR
ncbi:MAG TPA: FkbM family methyltransferase [Actinomycetota bacterium]|nr:FkbM family methyltransferase [Actinomycetota bacterium]